MGRFWLILILLTVSCSGDSSDVPIDPVDTPVTNSEWTFPQEQLLGTGRPFPLAKAPTLYKATDVDFIEDDVLVAVVAMGDEIKAYPYNYLNPYESVNDKIGDVLYSMTYCPLTQSGLLINREFKQYEFNLRASGYLLHDNVILEDENTEAYISQMLKMFVKGPFKSEYVETFNFLEIKWKTVLKYFPDAMVFTNNSITNGKSFPDKYKTNIKDGDVVYGIIDERIGKDNSVRIYHYDDFDDLNSLRTVKISGKDVIVIGNSSEHFITSYYAEPNLTYAAVQGKFPIVMKDSNENYWNVFGIAVEGPRTGEQLESPTAFFALYWAWEEFYEDFAFDE